MHFEHAFLICFDFFPVRRWFHAKSLKIHSKKDKNLWKINKKSTCTSLEIVVNAHIAGNLYEYNFLLKNALILHLFLVGDYALFNLCAAMLKMIHPLLQQLCTIFISKLLLLFYVKINYNFWKINMNEHAQPRHNDIMMSFVLAWPQFYFCIASVRNCSKNCIVCWYCVACVMPNSVASFALVFFFGCIICF